MFLSILSLLATCLVATILIETILAAILGVRGKDLIIVVLAQIVTNPIVVLVSNLMLYLFFQSLERGIFFISLVVMESFAIIAEALMYKFFFKDYRKTSPLVLSAFLNIASVILGLIAELIQIELE